MSRPWVAFFSQTGTEILDISRDIKYFPDVAVTNNKFKDINQNLFDFYRDSSDKTLIYTDPKIDSNTYREIFKEIGDNALITLHGWLRIVPADICEEYTIYNGHPGLINMYEDLKGKDPVHKVWKNYNCYEFAGSVIHKVTAEVDEGEIIEKNGFPLQSGHNKDVFYTFDSLNNEVRKVSKKLWINFIRNNINI